MCNKRLHVTTPHIWWHLLFFLCVILFSTSTIAQNSQRSNPSLIQRFWDIGCEFSGVVTRVRRSADNPLPEEPNFDNPEELFDYLYPLANVNSRTGDDESKVGYGESQRSSTLGTHSLSSWLEDLMELWHSECHNRREKRSAERRATSDRRATNDGKIRRKENAWTNNPNNMRRRPSARNSSSLANAMRRESYESSDFENDSADEYGPPGYSGRDESILQDPDDKDEGKDKDKLAALAGLLPPKPTINIPSPADKEDIFFSQYGGDIEYFFPLISFGIPFDGEITLLGFHGFRGIFPY